MRKIKKMGALITAVALTVTLIGTAADASAFSKTKYGFTLSGDHSISRTKGSAWGSVKPKSYVSIASVYKYKKRNGEVKIAPTDLTGAGNSTGADWSYTIPSGKSISITTKWTGIYKKKTITSEDTIKY
jgi:hypothetical protein